MKTNFYYTPIRSDVKFFRSFLYHIVHEHFTITDLSPVAFSPTVLSVDFQSPVVLLKCPSVNFLFSAEFLLLTFFPIASSDHIDCTSTGFHLHLTVTGRFHLVIFPEAYQEILCFDTAPLPSFPKASVFSSNNH